MARMRRGKGCAVCVSEFKAEFPPTTESGVAIICILLYATAARFELHAGASRLSPALATLPIFPESRVFHLLLEPGFVEHLFEFHPRLPRTNSPGVVG